MPRLLAAPEFKMAPGDIKFSEDLALPPYLLGFRGTQAERYIENFKVRLLSPNNSGVYSWNSAVNF